jgi:glyoxylase-like metal-dependent hydrolase (beta-lactamase superfamily II)
MLKKLAAPLALLALMGGPAEAQTVDDAMELLRATDQAIGASNARTIRYGGVDGYVTVIGQSYSPQISDGWPRFHLKQFTRVIDFENMSMREEQVRTQGQWPSELGGGLRPIIGERRTVAYYMDGHAWNENADGSITPAPRDATVRMLEIIMTPHGFVRYAMQADDLRMDTRWESFRSTDHEYTVSFTWHGPKGDYPITGWIDEDHHVQKVQTWFPSPVVGDQFVETRYAQWEDLDGFAFGPEVHQSVGTPPHPSYDFQATDIAFNVDGAPTEVPASVRGVGDDAGNVTTTELAPGVWMIGGGRYFSVAMEFEDYSLVIEAPLNETRAYAVMNEVRRLVPNKPLRYVVSTHHHFDHSGGLRGFAAEDVLIVLAEEAGDYYEALGTALHTRIIEPDVLGRTPRQVHYVRVQDRHEFSDDMNELQLFHVQTLQHASDMLIAYLPRQGILVEADLYSPVPPGTEATHRNMALLYNVQRVSIAPTRIVSIHDGEVPVQGFLDVVGQDRFMAAGQGLDAALNQGR